ncbi:Surfactin synthase thioesterase subunit [Peribacillus simplex]|uniref:Surfactin synthase thioesterase subunit n=1 Tax=Peribacillus simplex TaxID=1478 RepID=A0A9X8RCX9_9BACI|nr:alpha/beta fold hydrolase [Peribacillus simplex]SIR94076.1 Surfactin synthase thioesterase subunit [Peribacillus simplex]
MEGLKKTLFCFPYAGGSASFYREWKFEDDVIEVVPLEYPGHGSKYSEPLCDHMGDLTDILINEMETKHRMDALGSISLFGHSMGAIVAYEIAAKLEERYGNKVEHLFISSKSSPNYKVDQIDCSNAKHLKLSLEKIGGTNKELLETEDFMNIFLPIIQSDLNVLANYHHEKKHNEKVGNKAVLLLGSDDTVTKESIENWNEYIEHIEGLHILKGDHFYIKQNQAIVLKIIQEYLLYSRCEVLI